MPHHVVPNLGAEKREWGHVVWLEGSGNGHVVWKEGKSGMGSWLEGNVNGVMLYGRREMGI